jgi:hypothetical protein
MLSVILRWCKVVLECVHSQLRLILVVNEHYENGNMIRLSLERQEPFYFFTFCRSFMHLVHGPFDQTCH